MSERRIGPGDVLVFVYCLFVVAAGARSMVQLATHAGRAPVAYGLSAVSAVIYTLGGLALRRAVADPNQTVVARAWCVTELAGVVGVGILSLARRDLFPEPSVWSGFGIGYGLMPLILPLLALTWLHPTVTARM